MIEVWHALQNADLTEGRGPMVPKASFLRREDAAEAAKRLVGVMGYGHGEIAGAPLVVYETFEEWPDHTMPVRVDPAAVREALKKSALARLTPEERAALGF